MLIKPCLAMTFRFFNKYLVAGAIRNINTKTFPIMRISIVHVDTYNRIKYKNCSRFFAFL